MDAGTDYKRPDLHALAKPSFFKPYIIVNDKGHLESTHVIRWCFEKICGAFGGADMCNKTLVRLSLLRELTDISKSLNEVSLADIKKIAQRAGIVDYTNVEGSSQTIVVESDRVKKISDYLYRGIVTDIVTDNEDVAKKLNKFMGKYYKENKGELSVYPENLTSLFQVNIAKVSPVLIDNGSQIDSAPIDSAPKIDDIKSQEEIEVTKEEISSVGEEIIEEMSEENEEPDPPQEILKAIADITTEVREEVRLRQEKELENEELDVEEQEGIDLSENEYRYAEVDYEEELPDYENVVLVNLDDEINEAEKILNKGISTRVCRKALDSLLATQNKAMDLETRDDGDCFYDAFARGLSTIKGQTFTVQNLRDRLKVEVERLHDSEGNWVKVACTEEKDGIDSYEKYRTMVGTSFQTVVDEIKSREAAGEVVENPTYPPWGRPEIDGELLCKLFNVKLEITSVEVKRTFEGDEDQLPDIDPAKYFISEEVYPKKNVLDTDSVVEIAAYPGHFLAVKTSNELK